VLGTRNGFCRLVPFQIGIVVVYGIVALGLGSLTTGINAVAPSMTLVLQALGGLFIIYLGLQLILRKNRDTPEKVPTFANGALLQALNPKFPAVVLAVFANRHGQSTVMTATVILIVGAIGLLAYSLIGALFHARTISGPGFRALDLAAGSLLCAVGLYFSIQPLLGA
jgi:threonine/homoserine/homoserine lactone efflux protein